MCDVCLKGGEKCQNSHLVLGWTTVDLFNRKGEHFENTHWPKVDNTRKEGDKRTNIRRRRKKTTVVNVETSIRTNRKNQKKLTNISVRRLEKETPAIKVERRKKKAHGQMLLMICRSQLLMRI